jgi:hypothetical protein
MSAGVSAIAPPAHRGCPEPRSPFSGGNYLGGGDWDQRVVDWLVKDFKNSYGVDLSRDKMACGGKSPAA